VGLEAAILRMQIQGFYKLSYPGSNVTVKVVAIRKRADRGPSGIR